MVIFVDRLTELCRLSCRLVVECCGGVFLICVLREVGCPSRSVRLSWPCQTSRAVAWLVDNCLLLPFRASSITVLLYCIDFLRGSSPRLVFAPEGYGQTLEQMLQTTCLLNQQMAASNASSKFESKELARWRIRTGTPYLFFYVQAVPTIVQMSIMYCKGMYLQYIKVDSPYIRTIGSIQYVRYCAVSRCQFNHGST